MTPELVTGVPAELATGAMANFAAKESPTPAPEIRFTDGAGKPLSLAAFRGKVVVLNFWAGDCPPCRFEMPAFQRVYAAHQDEVLFLGVDVGVFTGLGRTSSRFDEKQIR